MEKTPKSMRLHIGIFGRRNVGKSSLLNAMTRQAVSIISEIAGTTTDPVEKPMELLPIGPVLFIDTAGVDDVGALGQQRVQRTRQVIDRTDVGIVVTDAGQWTDFEAGILAELKLRKTPAIVVFNKADLARPSTELLNELNAQSVLAVETVASEREGVLDLRDALIATAPDELINPPSLLGDLVGPGQLALLVIPIDMEAPKGRIILPQVQAIRDLLDHDAWCMVVKESGLADALADLKRPPALVVTDSQAFAQVAPVVPQSVPLTGFSILFARMKGDLNEFARGARAIETLVPGDRVLISESCTHHPIGDDIGRVKIPKWLSQRAGGEITFGVTTGHDWPQDLAEYKLVVQCGGCMHNRREMLSKIMRCRDAGVPITNYGVAIAATTGILERALAPFPQALETYLNA